MQSCKEGKELSSSHWICKILALPFLAFFILYLFRCSFYLPLLPHSVGFRFCQKTHWCHADSFLTVCSRLTSSNWWLSVSTSAYLPQVRLLFPQTRGVAPGTGDSDDVPGAIVETGPAKLLPVCHCQCRTNWGGPRQSLGVLPSLLLQQQVPPCHPNLLHSLAAVAPDNRVKGQRLKYWNTVRKYCCQKKRMCPCPRKHRDAVHWSYKTRSCCCWLSS